MKALASLAAFCRRTLGIVLLACAMPALAGGTINLGSKNFTEQHVLAALTAQYLTAKGYTVNQTTDLATIIQRNALENNQLDMVWDYTGTALIIYNHIDQRMSDEEAYQTVKDIDAKKGLVWLKPAPLNNTYALAMKRSVAEAQGIKTVSDLVAAMNRVAADPRAQPWQLGFDMEFAGRPDGLKPMQAMYKLELARPQIRQMDPGLVYNAIRDGFVQAGLVYTTDGRVKGFDLLVLEDDMHYFPSYAATPVIRQEVLDQNPGLADDMNALSALLDNDTIATLNAQVDIDHRNVDDVAADFLRAHKLIN
ncbi:glycine betaine ABC transporter substrate-binding protein [Silvimonas iriomotensis]|uniref:Glycine/betaine ABC transporter substrate-binding protein n=1 Tax=Silvimonas iriomotensis TaxID=449662 RepID=A0ABQ2P3W7_9NEIS|nr:glycine betaine ABC transporter substrate-binding protein [Silvimonas iriomotensis]GGP17605.1 glycine/betaine ABC transporter substrate-binding protein [Silvimonas iriomotensis]